MPTSRALLRTVLEALLPGALPARAEGGKVPGSQATLSAPRPPQVPACACPPAKTRSPTGQSFPYKKNLHGSLGRPDDPWRWLNHRPSKSSISMGRPLSMLGNAHRQEVFKGLSPSCRLSQRHDLSKSLLESERKEVMETLSEGINDAQHLQVGISRGHRCGKEDSQSACRRPQPGCTDGLIQSTTDTLQGR